MCIYIYIYVYTEREREREREITNPRASPTTSNNSMTTSTNPPASLNI